MQSTSLPVKKKLGLVQVFRGLASLLVVLCHLSGSTEGYFGTDFLGGIFLKGYIGVDFFFVLSGFIITYVHLNDLKNQSGQGAFIRKRFIRIYPFYWVIATIYIILLFLAGGKTTHLDHTLSIYSFDDWMFIIGSYWLIPMHSNPLIGVTWSLTYEILFYLIFLICITIGFNKAKYLVAFWFCAILVTIAVSHFYTLPELMILSPRIIQFLSGCIVAYLILSSYEVNKWLWLALTAAGTAAFIYIYPSMLKEPIGIIILAYIMGLIVYKVVLMDIKKENTYSPFLLLLGEASYSIYLSHLILLSISLRAFKIVVDQLSIQNFYLLQFIIFIMFIMIVTGGVLFFKYVESPLLSYLNKVTRGHAPILKSQLAASETQSK